MEKHIGGIYSVVILENNLTSEEAEEFEILWVAQESSTLVNWVNFSRETDFDAIERFHQLRDANRDLASKVKALESEDIKKAISIYFEAIDKIAVYAYIQAF